MKLTFPYLPHYPFQSKLKKAPQTYLSIRMQGNQNGRFPGLKIV